MRDEKVLALTGHQSLIISAVLLSLSVGYAFGVIVSDARAARPGGSGVSQEASLRKQDTTETDSPPETFGGCVFTDGSQ